LDGESMQDGEAFCGEGGDIVFLRLGFTTASWRVRRPPTVRPPVGCLQEAARRHPMLVIQEASHRMHPGCILWWYPGGILWDASWMPLGCEIRMDLGGIL
jgi:hypothetical protein